MIAVSLGVGPSAPGRGLAAPGAAARPALVLAGASSAAEAAEEARRQTGGRVLAVERTGGGWQVRVLTPSGEVRVVFIPGAGG